MPLVDEKIATNNIKTKRNEDTKRLFERIKSVETIYNTKTKKTQEADKMTVVLSQAPEKHQVVLTAVELSQKEELSMADLKEAVKQHCRLISRDKEEEEEEDIALITFKGKCHNCGTPGNIAKDCRKMKKKMKFNGS